MIEASKLRAGMTFVTADGKLIRVLEAQFWEMAYQHQTWKSTLQALEKGD